MKLTLFRPACHGFTLAAVLLLVLLMSVSGAIEPSTDPVVRIDGGEPVRALQGRISYFLDTTRQLTIADVSSDDYAGRFSAVVTEEPDFQYTTSAIWLKIPVLNSQSSAVDMRMTFQTNFMTELAVYQVGASGSYILLDQKEDSTFDSRPIPHPNIITPLTLQASERADLFVRYISKGSTTLPIRFETLASFDAWTQSYTAKLFMFYALMFAFAVMSMVAFAVMPRSIFLSYSFYAVTVILYIGQRDGVAFQYLWPNAPLFNGFASLPLGCLVGLSAAVFARIFLNTKRDYPGADLFLLFFIGGCIAIPFLAFVIGESPAKKLATYWVTLGAVSFLVIGLRAMRSIQPRIVFYVVGWLGIVCGTLLVTARDVLGISAGRSETLDIVRMATLFDATMMGLAMTAAILHIRKERDNSWRNQIVTLQANLALHERLNTVETRYEQAASEAEKRGRVLANASHDIRQPLFALRSSLRALEKSGAPPKSQAEGIERSLNYIEALVDDYMKEALEDETAGESLDGPATPLAVIFDAVQGMFAVEATTKGLSLVVVNSSKSAAIEAFPLLRVVTNLVANAVAYTRNGKVVVGCRRRGERILIEVYDTGPGLSEAQIEMALGRGRRGDVADANPGGEGLGLSIVRELSGMHDLQLSVVSTPGKGSCFSISAPLA